MSSGVPTLPAALPHTHLACPSSGPPEDSWQVVCKPQPKAASKMKSIVQPASSSEGRCQPIASTNGPGALQGLSSHLGTPAYTSAYRQAHRWEPFPGTLASGALSAQLWPVLLPLAAHTQVPTSSTSMGTVWVLTRELCRGHRPRPQASTVSPERSRLPGTLMDFQWLGPAHLNHLY